LVKEASKFYREARALALSQEQEEVVHLADALHARIFGRNKRTLEAWKIGQRVNLELLPEGDQKWFKKESLGWKKAVEENPEKAPKSKESEKPKSPVEK